MTQRHACLTSQRPWCMTSQRQESLTPLSDTDQEKILVSGIGIGMNLGYPE